ncbi:MAG: DUF3320 domain-containing protein [Thermoanaerobaculia bacterium]|nr:DUF3320 domain-containing protein [Thermoanaerobaculia bacterium]
MHQGLPEGARNVCLDEAYPPETSSQVIDADASQLRALVAVDPGHDLVMEGPPGTGKSQTITNLIAQALGRGKTVLFVAEKMAALQVVASRLNKVGLGEFCLEIHSSKANKRSVVQQIAASLDASLVQPEVEDKASRQLPEARQRLSEYIEGVHAPFGANAVAPFRAYGEMGRLAEAPRLRFPLDASAVPTNLFETTIRELSELAGATSAVEPVASHPFRGTEKTYFTEEQLADLCEAAKWVAGSACEVMAAAEEASTQLGLPPIRNRRDVDVASEISRTLSSSPGAPVDVLASEAWNAPPADASRLVAKGRNLRSLIAEARISLKESVADYDPVEDLEYVARKLNGRFGWLAWLDGRYRAIARQWKSFRLPSFQGRMGDQIPVMRTVARLREERAGLASELAHARSLFGELWRGEASNWDLLEHYIGWVVEYRRLCLTHGLSQRAHELAAAGKVDVSRIERLRAECDRLAERMTELRLALEAPPTFLAEASFSDIADRSTEIAAGWRTAPAWAAFVNARRAAIAGLGGTALRTAEAEGLPLAELPLAFQRTFWMRWLEAAVESRPSLRFFHGLTHEKRIEQFRELDQAALLENRTRLKARLRAATQAALSNEDVRLAMPALRREMAKNRAHKPVRVTLRDAGAAVRAIKRCFMMSPMTVAQLIDGSVPTFDLVVFDEASQLPTEDAVGAILRGRQLIVVGDPKQLPPTNFFAVANGQVTAQRDEDGNLLFEDTESVLEEFMGVGAPQARLKWHYRSTDESLIAFSNAQFYDSELMTFPSVYLTGGQQGLRFELVEDGVYEGKGVNWVEARRVVDAVVRHALDRPDLSLGVGTFSTSQQTAILDLLEERRRQDPRLDSFFERREWGGFFVKNLENIQGDERDVIYLSVSYAKARDGRLRYQFGPLNQQNGWRRLNVLITRARQEMRVFSSITCDDFHLESTTSTGARLLHDFLAYAQRRRMDSARVSGQAAVENEFERQVFVELSRRGLELVPQVGVSSYRIDLGVLDARVPGRFVCGIECDGASYHRSETARDRDRLRTEVLGARGWTLHRVWSTDWFKDREGQADRLVKLVGETRDRVYQELQTPMLPLRPVEQGPIEKGGSGELPPTNYVRPVAAPYRVTEGEPQWIGRSLLEAYSLEVDVTVTRVVETESPIHLDLLATRVASLWGSRAGSRIVDCIRTSIGRCATQGKVEVRGEFAWAPQRAAVARSRAEVVNPPAEHIAPEEYREAVLQVLRGGATLAREQLVAEVRTLLGFSRTGARLERQIAAAIDGLMIDGLIGEGSTGIGARSGNS